MDREIKFRAWHKQQKEMLKWNRHIKKAENEFFSNGNIILMQYIGFKDKNGQEIYEGDLVTFHTEYERGGTDDYYYEDDPTVVKWKESRAGFWPFYLNGRWRCDVINVEVVGNRFENPEKDVR